MYKALRLCSLLTLLLIFFQAADAQSPNPKFELYILAGQSNMAGRGPVTDEYKAMGNDSVFVLTKDLQWIPAKHPLHFDKPAIAGVGPGLAFGIAMAEQNKKVKIGLIPCAVGGTPIEHWLPGAFDSATNTHPWDDAVKRIQYAMQFGTIKGIIWHQGEANSKPEAAAQYAVQLTELINRFRKLTGNGKLPFVAGELGPFLANAPNINQQLQVVAAKDKNVAVASAANLTDKGDHLHFDSPSATELGKRYAAAMKELLKR